MIDHKKRLHRIAKTNLENNILFMKGLQVTTNVRSKNSKIKKNSSFSLKVKKKK
jgi:hypothetical protein